MIRRNLSGILLHAGVVFIIAACAKISSPTGGMRDRTPPVVVKSVPLSGSKNFKGQTISITFDEYVALDKVSEKLMVSPPLKKKPKVFLKGKSVITEFEEELKDSTTYTFYYQDAIKDLNEGNLLENFKFVFSTGSVIDSLSVTGNVYNSVNLEVPKKTLVLMYREMADSAVEKHLPEYISMIDQFGYFRIDNVRAGRYRLYALKDVDNSKNYNLGEEEFGFMDSPIEVTPEKNLIPVEKDTTKVIVEKKEIKGKRETKPKNETESAQDTLGLKGENQLILFTALKKNHYFTGSTRSQKYLMLYTLSLPPDTMNFEFQIPGAVVNSYILERSTNNDTLKVWLADSALYSKPLIETIIRYPFTDSVGMLVYKEDTIQMRFVMPRIPKGIKVKKAKYTFETNLKSGTLKPGQNIVLKSQTPFSQPDTSRIRLFEQLDSTKLKIPFSLSSDTTNSCRYFLNAAFLPGKNYLFIADSASFGNLYDESNDSIGIKFSVREIESYSKLTLSIDSTIGNYIIQLLDNKEKLVSEAYINKDGKVVFPLLESGKYRVRAIFDMNGDRKWTTGDFSAGRQPEPVSYYPSVIEVKTGWEVDQDWVMGAANFKDQTLREKVVKKAKKF